MAPSGQPPLWLEAGPDGVRLADGACWSLADLAMLRDGWLLVPLQAALQEQTQVAREMGTFEGRILLSLDRDLSAEWLAALGYTLGQSEFSTWLIEVELAEGGTTISWADLAQRHAASDEEPVTAPNRPSANAAGDGLIALLAPGPEPTLVPLEAGQSAQAVLERTAQELQLKPVVWTLTPGLAADALDVDPPPLRPRPRRGGPEPRPVLVVELPRFRSPVPQTPAPPTPGLGALLGELESGSLDSIFGSDAPAPSPSPSGSGAPSPTPTP